MNDITFIHPPHEWDGGKRKPDFFPMGIGYLFTELTKAGFTSGIIEGYGKQYTKEQMEAAIKKANSKIFGISIISTQYAYGKWLVKVIRKHHPKSTIIAGSVMPTLNPGLFLKNTDADFEVMGECEKTIVEFMKNYEKPKKVKSLVWRDGEDIKVNPLMPYIENLDSIEFPAWDKFDIKIYIESLKRSSFTHRKTMTVLTSRGCPYNCHFCSKMYKGFRMRSIENIKEEILELKKLFNIGAVFFMDSMITINKQRIIEICEMMKEMKLKWSCQGRVNTVDYKILKEMKNSGCVAIGYGIESGSQTILNNMNKHTTTDQIVNALRDTAKVGLIPIPQLMYGYPGETKATVEETLNTIKGVKKYLSRSPHVNFSITTPLPATPLYEDCLRSGKIKNVDKYLENLAEGYSSERKPVVRLTDFSDEEFYEYHEKLNRGINNAIMESKRHDIKYMLERSTNIFRDPSLILKYIAYLIRRGER